MERLEILIMLLAVLVGLHSVAEKIKFPYPIVLVIAGLLFGISPSLPDINMNPNVVFFIFLPPLLYEAANNTSWHEFRKWRRAILFLAIGLVLVTTVSVAAAAHYVIPGFTWQLGFLLGAIVSPPDAVAATSATKGLRLPKHVVAILEGESLVNDASALIAYRYALIATISGSVFDFSDAFLEFLVLSGSGIAIGLVVGFVIATIHRNFNNPTIETTLSILAPFVAYLAAEECDVSGVLAVVSCGLYIAWHSSELFSFETRIKIQGFWDILIFLLNGLVFILIGLQLPNILANSGNHTIWQLLGYGLFISLIAIIVRIAWIFVTAGITFYFEQRNSGVVIDMRQRWRETFIISWAGMRGVVSLATALAIPLTLDNGTAFPQRDVILFITFVVILVTLVFQGITLPFFVRKLKVQEPINKFKEDENSLRLEMIGSILNFIETNLANKLSPEVIHELKEACEHRRRYFRISQSEEPDENEIKIARHMREYFEGETAIIAHQRELLIQAHKENSYSSDIIRKIERDLDAFSMVVQTRINHNQH